MFTIIDGFPYRQHTLLQQTEQEMLEGTNHFYANMQNRRSIREFTNKPIDKAVILNILRTAGTAPSGANKQPWTFAVVSDPQLKHKIREAAEAEEKLSYSSRMPDYWKEDLAPLGTNWQKPFLEIAPYLIVVFKRSYETDQQGLKRPNYYVTESCGIACGFLLAAIHQAGLGALTHTPSPMNFLSQLLNRPENEKPFLLIPVGHIAQPCYVPDITKKTVTETTVWYE